jgi:enamine deaminase RidA (YjgF/YER057c/UK114 family)
MRTFVFCIALLITLTGCQNQPGNQEPPKGKVFFEKSYVEMHDGYSEAVVIHADQMKTIYISGQVGEGEDLESQMRSAIAKLKGLLGKEGASMYDVVKMNTYIVDYGPETLEVFRRVRKEEMGDMDMPASTLVGVEALALPEWLIEIEAVAILPNAPLE